MATQTGTITSASSTIVLNYTTPDPEIIVGVSGTYAGVSVKFEISPDGLNYYLIGGVTIAPTQGPGPESSHALLANETRYWRFLGTEVGQYLRVSATAYTSGTATVVITSYPTAGSSDLGSGGSVSVYQKWSTLTASFGIFDDVGVNPTIKNLASGSLQISGVIDNTVNLNQWLDLVLNCKGAGAFTAGGTVSIWILPSLDGTTYEDGSASVTPARAPDDYFFLRAVATAQVLERITIAIPPSKYKLLLRNDTSGGQAFTNVNGDNTLVGYTHS